MSSETEGTIKAVLDVQINVNGQWGHPSGSRRIAIEHI